MTQECAVKQTPFHRIESAAAQTDWVNPPPPSLQWVAWENGACGAQLKEGFKASPHIWLLYGGWWILWIVGSGRATSNSTQTPHTQLIALADKPNGNKNYYYTLG